MYTHEGMYIKFRDFNVSHTYKYVWENNYKSVVK